MNKISATWIRPESEAHPPTPRTRRRKFELKRVPFQEICESVGGIDNRSPRIKLTRLFVRYLVRAVGYRSAAKVLRLASLAPKASPGNRSAAYVRYLIEINRLRLEYLDRLAANDQLGAVASKKQWARLTARDSFSRRARYNARGYLSLLTRSEGPTAAGGRPDLSRGRVSTKRIYIYGPNAKAPPSVKYQDYSLVLMKPIDLEIDWENEKILFLNSVYYNNVVAHDDELKRGLAERHDEIFVSCREASLSAPFNRAKFPLGDSIAGPMALGRVLYNLIRQYGSFTCVIEGCDFYLGSTMYGSYYPSLARNEHREINEQVICSGLADHDSLYNFLYVKELTGTLKIVDSTDFLRIMAMTGEEYLGALAKARAFESLRDS